MISARNIIIEIMDELGWDEIISDSWAWIGIPNKSIAISFEQRKPQDQKGSYEIETEIYFVPNGLAVKRFTVSGRKVSWKHDSKDITIDLAEPDSLEMIIKYVKE